jgi:hypothetical protein
MAKFSKIKLYSNDSDANLTFEGPVITCENTSLNNVDFVFNDAFEEERKLPSLVARSSSTAMTRTLA